MALAGRPAGEALTALRYLGSERANSEAITRIRAVLPEEAFEVLRGPQRLCLRGSATPSSVSNVRRQRSIEIRLLPEQFLLLDSQERRDVYEAAAQRFGAYQVW